jgi:hypothetical protein
VSSLSSASTIAVSAKMLVEYSAEQGTYPNRNDTSNEARMEERT